MTNYIIPVHRFPRPFILPMSLRAPRKGENYELGVDLNSEYRDKRKDAIKRVIASMTVGKGARLSRLRTTKSLNLDISPQT